MLKTLSLEDLQAHPDDEDLISQLLAQRYAVLDDFLSPEEVQDLHTRLLDLKAEAEFKPAGVGSAENFTLNRRVRGDYIHWLESDQASPITLLLLRKMQALRQNLNRQLFLSLKDFEGHFAYYPVGAAYQKHVDQFQNNNHRKMSCICYLNADWRAEEGGALRLYLPGKEETRDILPLAGRMVCFKSDELEHEVLPATRERYSVTGWFLDQLHDLTFLP